MRRTLIAFAGLALISTSAVGAGPEPSMNAQRCAASLEKLESGTGFRMTRQCGSAVAAKNIRGPKIAREPVADGMGIGGQTIALSLFGAGLIGGGLFGIFSGRSAGRPNSGTGVGGVVPASP